jgi:hypothetical protein
MFTGLSDFYTILFISIIGYTCSIYISKKSILPTAPEGITEEDIVIIGDDSCMHVFVPKGFQWYKVRMRKTEILLI